MKVNKRVALLAAVTLVGAGSLWAFTDEENHTPPPGGGECGNMANFKQVGANKFRHGGSGVSTPSGYTLYSTVYNRNASNEDRDWPWLAEDWSHHDYCGA